MKLYHSSASPNSRRVRILIAGMICDPERRMSEGRRFLIAFHALNNVASRAASAITRRMRPTAAKIDIVSATFRKRL
jgi:hypothetical protein